jgi:hypothetical protein
MDVLARLTTEEQFAVRTVEAAELRAHNQLLQFKMEVEAKFKALQDAAQTKSKATLDHLTELAKKYELKIEEVGFDFEQLAFHKK